MNLPILPFNIISNIYPAPYKIDSDSFNNAVKQYLKIKKNYEINKILISNDMHRRLAYINYMRTHPNRLRAGITLVNVNGNNVVLPFDGLDNLKVLNPVPAGKVEFKTVIDPRTGRIGMLPVVSQLPSVEEALKKLAKHLNDKFKSISGCKTISDKLSKYIYLNDPDQLKDTDFKKDSTKKEGDLDGAAVIVSNDNFDLLTHFIHLQNHNNNKSASSNTDLITKAREAVKNLS
jgi:hypothetical protein